MIWLVIAVVFLLSGHFVKVYRWRLFIELYEKCSLSVLLRSLSIAHAINFIIPFHIGDLYRIWYSGKRMSNGIKFSFATIAIEHYIDLIVLALLCGVLYAIGHNTMGMVVLLSMIATTAILLTVITMKWDSKTKFVIVKFAEIFNSRIELNILGFIWTFVTIFKKLISSISKTQVILSTGLMWLLYMASYWCFAESLQYAGINVRLRDVVDIFFNRSSILNRHIYEYGSSVWVMTLYISIYVLLPLFVIYLLSYFYNKSQTGKCESQRVHTSVIPHVDSHEALVFLETFFKGNIGDAYLKGFLEVNKNVSILEDHSAGSNAVTLLCTDGQSTFYRKFAIGADGGKLYAQIEWLQRHHKIIALPRILKVKKESNYCSYDMEYNESAQNFFTFIHTHTIEQSWYILKTALEDMKNNLYQFEKHAEQSAIHSYIGQKVTKNLNEIKKSSVMSDILTYQEVYVNGIRYDNLSHFEDLFDTSRLTEVFSGCPVCDIHGDMTIENIICSKDGYYLIDPNTGNILECPYLDLAKLFQSLHGGYEFLMRIRDVSVNENHIDFTFMRSSAYDALYQYLRQYIVDTYGEQELQQVYYHEIIHWLRLMPYKLSHLGERALVFYAGMLIVLNDVFRRS